MAAKPKPKPKPKTKAKPEVVVAKPRLKPEHELFCQYYTSATEFFGNGVQSYMEAYGINPSKPGAYAGARASASELLTKPNILERINRLLDDLVMNDEHVDKQLGFLISQNAEFNTKLGAIKEYNALKSRVTKQVKIDGEVPISLVKFFKEKDGSEEASADS